MQLDIRQLRYFLAIVEEGSISRAAERLGVAQPSLSQHVIKLEHELGGPLLNRTPRGISPTEIGILLLEHARTILHNVTVAQEDVRQHGEVQRGHVSFGMPSSVSLILTIPLVESARERLPKVSLHVAAAMSGHIRGWLENQSLDVGILYNATNLRHLDIREIMTEDLYLIAAPGRIHGNVDADGILKRHIRLSDVSDYDLVLPSQSHGLRGIIERFARISGSRLNVVVELDVLTQIKSLVARNPIFSILSLAAVHEELKQGRLVAARIVDPPIRRSVNLVRNPNRMVTRASKEVENLVVEIMLDLTRKGKWRARISTEQL